MLVSIIVPFYGVELYFRRCLDSIIRQSYQNLEIILVDDCSPDSCLTIAKEYAQKDVRIKIIEHKTNLRQGGGRNSGMVVAKGEYIWFIDSDDSIASPYAVEHLVAIAQRDRSDMVIFNAQSLNEDGILKALNHFYSGVEERVFNDKNLFYPVIFDFLYYNKRKFGYFGPEVWNKLFRRSFLEEYHFTFLENTLYEDISSLILFPLARTVTVVPYVYYNYYQREGSSSHIKPPSSFLNHFHAILEHMRKIYTLFLDKKLKDNTLVLAFFLPTLIYSLRQMDSVLTDEEWKMYALKTYSFLKKELYPDISFKDFNPWPSLLGNDVAWERLFQSFDQECSDKKKIEYIENIKSYSFVSPMVKDENKRLQIFFVIKKISKMLLPYGMVRFIQIQKSKESR
ncbi:glycosyltransferase family 2 protein [Entomospira culicis]|uniref:Glycosyltransferase family 2 protein n=1 Tax=Entomospira culicis TaxID=2719989 RepID=A0A968L0A0_9SPIO|nr:glycosyltransferase family 2 protein [Entomospira culicis]NIZ19912.1 glycosyltransferase family 2 protein [Entomospira culicis]NIZ70131.1 glycosyltransferase family 2 protein [Entomospira culicis]WDI38058.1 glycosyltransferase family 2 protein [Entomospira culicis]WDI39681.1 glycosyltransferase family 2 protein [Entomospira culicis]